jgi:hypothetical protein
MDTQIETLNAAALAQSPSMLMHNWANDILIQGFIDGLTEGIARISGPANSIMGVFRDIMAQTQQYKITMGQDLMLAATAMQGPVNHMSLMMDTLANSIYGVYNNAVLAKGALLGLQSISGGGAGGTGGTPIPQLAYGGTIPQHKIIEFNEPNKNLPFEIASFGNRSFMLANQNGYMTSPLNSESASGSSMTGSSGAYYEGDIYINGSGLNEDQLTRAITRARDVEREKTNPNRQWQKNGRR